MRLHSSRVYMAALGIQVNAKVFFTLAGWAGCPRGVTVWSKWMMFPGSMHLSLQIWTGHLKYIHLYGRGGCVSECVLLPGHLDTRTVACARAGWAGCWPRSCGPWRRLCRQLWILGCHIVPALGKASIARKTYPCQPFLPLKYEDNILFFTLQGSCKNGKEWNVLIRNGISSWHRQRHTCFE